MSTRTRHRAIYYHGRRFDCPGHVDGAQWVAYVVFRELVVLVGLFVRGLLRWPWRAAGWWVETRARHERERCSTALEWQSWAREHGLIESAALWADLADYDAPPAAARVWPWALVEILVLGILVLSLAHVLS